jgi:uncharacterized protein CbrC (UPF0167 family)
MAESPLPKFTYHPDPEASGSVVVSTKPCLCCHLIRGWIYAGPVFSEQDLDEAVCPWCISDGTAHRLFGAEFFDPPAVGDYGRLDAVPSATLEEVCFRTPSFCGWQQERWLTHCGDACLFLGCMGAEELEALDASARDAIALESGFSGTSLIDYMSGLNKDWGPTAYVFRCRHCGTWSGYSDCG